MQPAQRRHTHLEYARALERGAAQRPPPPTATKAKTSEPKPPKPRGLFPGHTFPGDSKQPLQDFRTRTLSIRTAQAIIRTLTSECTKLGVAIPAGVSDKELAIGPANRAIHKLEALLVQHRAAGSTKPTPGPRSSTSRPTAASTSTSTASKPAPDEPSEKELNRLQARLGVRSRSYARAVWSAERLHRKN